MKIIKITLALSLIIGLFSISLAQTGSVEITSTPSGAPFVLDSQNLLFNVSTITPFTSSEVPEGNDYTVTWGDVQEYTTPPAVSNISVQQGEITSINGEYIPGLPNAPTNLTATPLSDTRVSLTWQNNSQVATSFLIYRMLTEDADFSFITTIDLPDNSYIDTGLLPNTEYLYEVIAMDSTGTSLPSNVADVTTKISPPVAPTNLSALAVDSNAITISWQDNSDSETGFEIQKAAPVGGTFFSIATVGADETTYTDVGLIPCSEYNYRVRAINGTGPSDFSNEASAITLQGPEPIADFSANPVGGFSPLSVQFTDASQNANDWMWDFGDSGTSNLENPQHTYTTSEPTTFSVALQVSNSCFTTSSTKTDYIFVDASPSDLIVTSFDIDFINLSWQDHSSQETGYELERQIGINGTFEPLAQPGADNTSYEDGGLTPSTLYIYRLRAVSGFGASPYIYARGTTVGPPVTDFTSNITSGFSPTTVQFLSTNTYNADNYLWDFGDGSTDTAQNPEHFYNPSVNTTYTVTLFAINSLGEASTFKENYITIGLPPTNLIVTWTPEMPLGMNLSWQDNSDNETGFEIFRKTSLETDFTLLAKLAVNETTYVDYGGDSTIGLSKDIGYIYRVRAITSDTASDFTNDGFAQAIPIPFAIPTSGFVSSVDNTKSVQFIDQSTFATQWFWDFGDGNTDTAQNPVHIFTSDINTVFTVTLVADNANLSPSTTTLLIYLALPPSNLQAVAVSTTQINLTWNDNSDNEIGYLVEQQVNGGSFAQIAQVPADSTTYNDTGLQPSTDYGYQVRAITSQDTSDYTNVATARTSDISFVHAAFVANPPRGYNQLTTQFTDQSANATSWAWDFGDGFTSNSQSPTHIYSGTTITRYTVKLVVSNVFGTDSIIKTNYIVVSPLGVFGKIPDFRFTLNTAVFNLVSLDSSTFEHLTWDVFVAGEFARPILDSTNFNLVSFATPSNPNESLDTVTFVANETTVFSGVVKYSTFLIKKMPFLPVQYGLFTDTENTFDININDYVYPSGPTTWSRPVIRPTSDTDTGKIDSIIDNSTYTFIIGADGRPLDYPVDVIVKATPEEGSNDKDMGLVRLYEIRNFYGRFNYAFETAAYGYEALTDATNGKAAISWIDSFEGANGVLRLTFSKTNMGIKITQAPGAYITTRPNQWYTARVRILCNATTLDNTFAPNLYAYNGTPPNPTEISGYGTINMATTWTWMECPIYTTGNSLYLQLVIRNGNTSLRNVYIDEFQIIEREPEIVTSYGESRIPISAGRFTNVSDTTAFAFEPVTNTTLPAFNVASGMLDFTIFGGNTFGVKLTGQNSPGIPLTLPVTLGKGVGASGKINATGTINSPLALVMAFGTPAANSSNFKEFGATATINTLPTAASDYRLTAGFNSHYPFMYYQAVLKGSGDGHYYLDDFFPYVDTDTIHYWDHTLFE